MAEPLPNDSDRPRSQYVDAWLSKELPSDLKIAASHTSGIAVALMIRLPSVKSLTVEITKPLTQRWTQFYGSN